MLKFAQLGPPEADELPDSGLDRAKLREEYEAGLSLLQRERFEEAKELLGRLVKIQPPAVTRDEVWLRRFRLLCWRNLALAHQALQEQQQALECLKAAVFKCARKESQPLHSVSLWRQLADAAVAAGDWEMATQALEQCLRFWPREPLLLRALAQSALRLGDFPRCQQALSQLEAGENLEDREKWLQLRLKRRFELPLYSGAAGGPEAEFQALNLTRAKRRRESGTVPGLGLQPEGCCLMRLTILDLLQSLRTMAAQAVPPFRPVYFYLAKEDDSIQQETAPVKEGDAMSKALLDAFRAMLVKPWPRGGSASRWLLQSLDSRADAVMTEESQAVSSFLELTEESNMVKSKSQCFRTWLFDAIRFTAEHWHDILRTSMQLSQLTCLEVELLHAAVLFSHPTISSEDYQSSGSSNINLGRHFWAHSWFLNWVEQPLRPGESPEPRIWLRDFIRQRGLALADACVTVSKAVQWLCPAGRSILRAWLFWHPTFGLSSADDVGHLRGWLEGGLGFDTKLGQLNEENEARVAQAVHRASASSGELLQLLSAGQQLLEQAQQVLPLTRCLALSKFGGSEDLTSEKLEHRLQKLKEVLATRETPEVANSQASEASETGSKRFSERLDKDALDALLRQSFEDLDEMQSPTVALPQAMQHAQNRIFDCENALTDHVGMVPQLLSFASKILKKSALDLTEMAEEEWPQVHPSYFLMLIRCSHFGVHLLDTVPKATLQESNTRPLLYGLREGIFLKPVMEQLAVVSLCIAANLCERILNHRIARDWSLLAHCSIVLGLKCLGTLLVGHEEAKGEARGGMLLAQGSHEFSLPMRHLWQRLSRLLAVGHDLTLELTENFANTPGSNFLAEKDLALACAIIFGQYRKQTHWRLSASKETLMSMPQLLMSLCLRADCPMLQRWRSKCITWQKQVEGEQPRAWKAGFRGWLQEEAAADSPPEDLPEDDETSRLLGRAMVCLWPIPQLDQKAASTVGGRNSSLCRILTRNLAYITAINKKITSYSGLDEADGVVAPHIMSLAVEVHGKPRPQDEVFWQAAATQLDHQIFTMEFNGQLSQVLFHPLMMNGALLHLICTELDPVSPALNSFDKMFKLLKTNGVDVENAKDIPSQHLRDFFSDAASQARAQTYAELMRLRDSLSMKEDGDVTKRHTGKTSCPSEDHGQSNRLLKLEVEELSMAEQLHKTALSARPLTSLPFANPYLELAARQSQQVQSSMKDLLQVVPCIIKGLSISPQSIDLWNRLTEVVARIYFLQDDMDCSLVKIFQRLQAYNASPRLRSLYSQAKILNLMQQAALRQSIKAGPQEDLPKLARQWFERRLDLLILTMLRRRYVQGDAKIVLRRCHYLAKSLLWFLLKCTDYGEVLTYTMEALREAPPSLEDWLHLASPTAGGQSQPLLRFRTGEGAIPPGYLWYIPYVMGRIEWKLYKLQGESFDAIGRVLGYLSDACQVETTLRAQQQALAMEGFVPKMTPRKHQATDFTYGVCEPWFRLQRLRVQLCLRSDEGWRWAASKPFGYACDSLNETVADAVQGLDACVIFDKSYQHKVDMLKASIELHFKEWDNASQWVIRLFTGINDSWKSVVGHSHDPWLTQERRRRKEEREKLRALFICLGLYKGLLQECLPGCQVSVPTDLKAFSRLEASYKDSSHGAQSLGAVHPGHRTKVQQEIRNLTLDRPQQWQALQEVTSKLASYATRVVDLSDSFRSFTAVLLIRALREGCASMAKAGVGRAPQRKGGERPHFDWQMFQTFTHLCEDCENTWGIEVKEMQQEIEKLQDSVVTAALRLYKYTFGAAGLTPTPGRQVPRFSDAKAFLETFTG